MGVLVLSRKRGERVLVTTADGARIWITVIEIDAGKVRLGFKAPRDVEVLREELVERGDD